MSRYSGLFVCMKIITNVADAYQTADVDLEAWQPIIPAKEFDVKNNNLLELSTRAYKLIFRMCESYELWCKETNQSQLIQLDVLD